MSNGKKIICYGFISELVGYLVTQLHLFNIVLPNFLKGFVEGFSITLGIVLILWGLYMETPIFKFKKNK